MVCCEVLEHSERWRDILHNVAAWQDSLVLVITCAGPGRKPHSAIDGGPLRDGEYYANISAEELRAELIKAGFRTVYVDQHLTDTRAIAIKQEMQKNRFDNSLPATVFPVGVDCHGERPTT